MARWRVLVLVLVIIGLGCTGPKQPAESFGLPSPLLTAHAPTPAVSMATATPVQAIEHATGATDVVMRTWRSGGMLYPGTTVDEAPTFTLYGDGRVIYTTDRPLPDGRLVRELRQAQLTEEQVGALLGNALGAGGLAMARDRYADVPVADASTTNFEIHAGGVHKTVAVYALGEFDDPGPDADARAAFEALAESLRDFGAEVTAGNAIDQGAFEPTAYRVTIFPIEADDLPPTADWPWPDLEPSDFPRDNSGFGRLVVTGAQGAVVAGLAVGDIGDPVVVGPDGVKYLIRARPLLPDEVP